MGPRGPSSPKLRHYAWCRLSNDFPDLPIWRAVAQRARVPVHQVIAVVLRLECLANKSVPRGFIADMSVPEFAASLDCRPDVVARIRVALEEPDIAWIDQDYVVDFSRRNPDHDDPTAAERQRRRRAKLKQERQRFSAHAPPAETYPQSRDVTRDSVTVTPRSDQIIKKERSGKQERSENEPPIGPEPSDGVHRNIGESGDPGEIEIWLAFHGKRIVAERCKVLPGRAWLDIARWRKELGEDIAALAQMIADADHLGLERGRFTDRIRDQIIRYRYEEKGPPLPLPPVIAGRRTGGDHG